MGHRVLADRDPTPSRGQSRGHGPHGVESAASSPGERPPPSSWRSFTRKERRPAPRRGSWRASATACGRSGAVDDGDRRALAMAKASPAYPRRRAASWRSRRPAPATGRPSGPASRGHPPLRSPMVTRKSCRPRSRGAARAARPRRGRSLGRERGRAGQGGPRRGSCGAACRGAPAGPCPRRVAEEGVLHLEAVVVGGDAHDREGAPLALAERAEEVEALRGDGEDVALLRLVAPDLRAGSSPAPRWGRRAGRCARRGRRRGRARGGVREAARAHVVDREDRVRVAERPAAVDDLLGPALDLRVAALDGVEVEFGCVRPVAIEERSPRPCR